MRAASEVLETEVESFRQGVVGIVASVHELVRQAEAEGNAKAAALSADLEHADGIIAHVLSRGEEEMRAARRAAEEAAKQLQKELDAQMRKAQAELDREQAKHVRELEHLEEQLRLEQEHAAQELEAARKAHAQEIIELQNAHHAEVLKIRREYTTEAEMLAKLLRQTRSQLTEQEATTAAVRRSSKERGESRGAPRFIRGDVC